MAICNLFKKITKNNGNFLMCSLYTEDLTKSSTTPGFYRVVPSKFIAIDANYNNEVLKKYTFANNDLNIGLPLFLQNDFENGCAILKGLLDKPNLELNINNKNTNHWSTNIFWNALFSNKIFSIDNIKYVGDINIQSYDELDGMGYSEIYCFIPNDAKAKQYKVTESSEKDEFLNYDKTKEFVEGYNEDLPITTEWTNRIKDKNDIAPNYNYARKLIFNFENDDNEKIKTQDNFNFNTIIILYDVKIKDRDGNILLYKTNIPLGVYITGTINKDGSVNNEHTKYSYNSDIYDSGTSYGLRICTRFSITPESDTIKAIDTQIKQNNYSAFCLVMTAFADTQSKMNNILNNIQNQKQNYNELYDIFKNSRTNVPYIKDIGGLHYWFVNGRKVYEISRETINSLTNEEIDEYCKPIHETKGGYLTDDDINNLCPPSECNDKNNDNIPDYPDQIENK